MSTIEQAFDITSPARLVLTESLHLEHDSAVDELLGAMTPQSIDDWFAESGFMTLQSITNWFVEAVPEPTDKNKAVQLGCHFEEVSEMLDALGETSVAQKLSIFGDCYKKAAKCPGLVGRDALLDSLCDQIVTAVGVAHMFGMNIQGALAEVNRSNYSKFVDGKPVFDANGKIDKPASYSKPDLTPFVGSAS